MKGLNETMNNGRTVKYSGSREEKAIIVSVLLWLNLNNVTSTVGLLCPR